MGNEIRVLFILNLHDDSPRPAMQAGKFAFVKGVGYMSRKRQIDRRFLHGWLHFDSIFLQIIISPILSNTNSAIAVNSALFLTHEIMPVA